MTITETSPSSLALFEADWVPRILPDDSPRVRESHPIESHQAADSITVEGKEASQAYILGDLRKHGRSAAWEIEKRAEELSRSFSPSRLRTALKELEEAGRVIRSKGGTTPRGRACALFTAVQS